MCQNTNCVKPCDLIHYHNDHYHDSFGTRCRVQFPKAYCIRSISLIFRILCPCVVFTFKFLFGFLYTLGPGFG